MLFRSIELNPVRAHIVKSPSDYEFCSFSEIKRKTELGVILTKKIIGALKKFGLGALSDAKVYSTYSEPLCNLGELVAIDFLGNLELKLIYQKHSLWSSGRSISLGDESF